MILTDIKQYLKLHGQATLADMSLHFKSSPEALQGMLDVWVKKGKIITYQANNSCGEKCGSCHASKSTVYVWTDRPLATADKFPRIVCSEISD